MKRTIRWLTLSLSISTGATGAQPASPITRGAAISILRHDYFSQSFELGEEDGRVLPAAILKDARRAAEGRTKGNSVTPCTVSC